MPNGNGASKQSVSQQKSERKRAQPGDFERQVDQIRKDIDVVRANLQAAEQALSSTAGSAANEADKIGPNKEN